MQFVQIHINQWEKINTMMPTDREVMGVHVEPSVFMGHEVLAVRFICEDSPQFLVNHNGETFDLGANT